MADPTSMPVAQPSPRWFGLAHLVIFGAGIGFFVLSFVALGVLPGLRLEREMAKAGPKELPAYSKAELRGRGTYVSLGCALCHTQQIRYLPTDVRRWGPPTQAWETRYDFPQLWGTRRIGPDLARESGVRSDDWQLAHLYDPTSVVPGSVMPKFPWLFDGSPARPTAVANDLLAYLNTLGRARQAMGESVLSRQADAGMGPAVMTEIADLCAAPFVNPSQPVVNRALAGATALKADLGPTVEGNRARGARGALLFAQNCAGCHGAVGDGAGPAAAGLMPRPADLRASRYTTAALTQALWNGVAGSSMPAWRELSAADLANLATHVEQLHDAGESPSGAPDTTQLARGATVYAANCVSCHGTNGDGRGPAAHVLLPRPADLTLKQPNAALIQRVLSNGIPGTSMPPWPGLSGADRAAVTAFVRSLYGSGAESSR